MTTPSLLTKSLWFCVWFSYSFHRLDMRNLHAEKKFQLLKPQNQASDGGSVASNGEASACYFGSNWTILSLDVF